MIKDITRTIGRLVQTASIEFWHMPIIQRVAGALQDLASRFGFVLGMRKRYVLTRNNRVRIRYVFTSFVCIICGLLALTLSSNSSNAVFDVAAYDAANIAPASGVDGIEHALMTEPRGMLIQSRTVPKIPEPLPLDREITVEPGDALGLVMQKQGVGNSVTANIIDAMKEHYDPRNIKAGQKIALHFEEEKDGGQRLKEMKMPLSAIKTLVVARANESFSASIDKKKVEKKLRAREATVIISLYGSAAKAGIPQGVVAEAIRIYSWNVDFQRDIRPDDKIEVMYESYETEQGHVAEYGNIIYAKLTLSGKEIPLYRFKMADGRVDYFQQDGISIKRTLMKTPINGARMSSGYGMRRHPVLGYSKMHKGVDFAAPTGTPIFAAGDGVVEKAGWFSSYGKYVRIRHNSKLKTAYAHMNKIRSTVKVGKRVTQGQVIGTVGTTGRSTGPHLHYEVLSNGKQVSPRSVDLPIGEELTGKQKQKFKAQVLEVDKQYVAALEGTKLAMQKNNKKFSFF